MTGVRSSYVQLVRDTLLDQLVADGRLDQDVADILRDANYAFELIKGDVERLAQRKLDASNNLSDVEDAAAARENLGISDSGSDLAGYLAAANNLSDVDDPATSASNLGLGTSDDVEHATVTIDSATFGSTEDWQIRVGSFTRLYVTGGLSGASYDALYLDASGMTVLLDLDVNGALAVDGSATFGDDVTLGDSVSSIAFYGQTPRTRQDVTDAITSDVTAYTADGTYSSNEQNMLNQAKSDIQGIASTLSELLTAMHNIGIIEAI